MPRACTAILVAALFSPVTPARADEPIVLVLADAAGTRPDFGTVVTIQLTGLASVERPGVVEGETLSDRVAGAASLSREHDAAAAAWVEPGEVPGELRMIVVGPREDRALIDIVREPEAGDEGWDVDRTLALKLRAIVERVKETEANEAALGEALARDAPPEESTPEDAAPEGDTSPDETGPVETAPGAPRAGFLSRAGAWGATASGDVGPQAAAAFGLGASLSASDVRVELDASLRVATALDMHDEALGDVELSELAPALTVAVLFDVEGVWVGGRVGAPLRVLRAVGTTAAGARGETTRLVPAVSAGLVGRLSIAGPIGVELEAGVEVALDDRAFGLNQTPVGELGRGRSFALVSLVISEP